MKKKFRKAKVDGAMNDGYTFYYAPFLCVYVGYIYTLHLRVRQHIKAHILLNRWKLVTDAQRIAFTH